jgi:hypothetical protein
MLTLSDPDSMGRQRRTHGAQVYCTSSPGDRQHLRRRWVLPRGIDSTAARKAPAEPKASAPQVIERLVDALDGDDFHAVDTLPGLVCRRDDGAMESKLGGFSQSLLTALYGPDFTCQAYFTKHKRFTI